MRLQLPRHPTSCRSRVFGTRLMLLSRSSAMASRRPFLPAKRSAKSAVYIELCNLSGNTHRIHARLLTFYVVGRTPSPSAYYSPPISGCKY